MPCAAWSLGATLGTADAPAFFPSTAFLGRLHRGCVSASTRAGRFVAPLPLGAAALVAGALAAMRVVGARAAALPDADAPLVAARVIAGAVAREVAREVATEVLRTMW